MLKNTVGHQVELDGYIVKDGEVPYVIAEIGQNHNGDIEIAKKLIDMAVRCKVNASSFKKTLIVSSQQKPIIKYMIITILLVTHMVNTENF